MKQLQPANRARERGVTLMEMTVVLALISMMALITIPNFISIYQSARVKATARNAITDMRNARQLAISSNARTKVSFKVGTNIHNYEVYREKKDRMTGTSEWVRTRWGDLGAVMYIQSSNFEDSVAGDDLPKDIVFLPNGTVLPPSSIVPPPYFVVLRTEQKVTKKDYRLEFSPSGNVTLK
jgi:prepilin-type N-terminal cleavage/methylation domain-containing protein